MCLNKDNKVKTAPRRTRAWKVVKLNREPVRWLYHPDQQDISLHDAKGNKVGAVNILPEGNPLSYKKGSIHVKRQKVGQHLDARGFHVFTRKKEALNIVDAGRTTLITVMVNPLDWVADGKNNGRSRGAIYRMIRVLD